VEQHAEGSANVAEHFQDRVGDGMVFGRQIGLGSDGRDAWHDDFLFSHR
jgi:hypothetical protein